MSHQSNAICERCIDRHAPLRWMDGTDDQHGMRSADSAPRVIHYSETRLQWIKGFGGNSGGSDEGQRREWPVGVSTSICVWVSAVGAGVLDVNTSAQPISRWFALGLFISSGSLARNSIILSISSARIGSERPPCWLRAILSTWGLKRVSKDQIGRSFEFYFSYA